MEMKKKRRKFSRQRGSGNHGWGHKKKHRGGGSRGGRGFAGLHKHKYSLTVSKKQDHYGKKGFSSLKTKDTIINMNDLVRIAKGKSEIDLAKAGYTKLLGGGSIDFPLVVRVVRCTDSAKEKIEKAGGKVIGETENEAEAV